jgi:hypothetical protein
VWSHCLKTNNLRFKHNISITILITVTAVSRMPNTLYFIVCNKLAYITEACHIHWSSVKLAYLIGWRHRAPAPIPTSPNSRFVTGLSDRQKSELNLTGRVLPLLECENRYLQESSDTSPERQEQTEQHPSGTGQLCQFQHTSWYRQNN